MQRFACARMFDEAAAAKVKQLDFAPQAEAATVEKMVASARKGV